MYTGCTLDIHYIYTCMEAEQVIPCYIPLPCCVATPLPGYTPLPRHPAPYSAALPYQLLTMVASYKLLGEQLWTTQEQA